MVKGLTIVAAATAILALGGCALFSKGNVVPSCPVIKVPMDAESVTKFRPGSGRDIIDIDFEGEILGHKSTDFCDYDIDDETGLGTMTVVLTPRFQATRGAANKNRKANFTYFVTLTDADKKPIVKQAFPIGVEFPGSSSKVTFEDEDVVELSVPLKKKQRGKHFKIYIGFQLSKEQLEFNRRRRAMAR